MATVSLTTSPTQIDDGTSVSVLVTNTGGSDVELSRGGRLRPNQSRTVYPEGVALTAAALTGTGQVTTVATAAPTSQAQQVAANTAAIAGIPGTYAPILNVQLTAWALANAFRVVSATRDANGAITTASVVWPDGSTGTFTTDTASTAFPGAIDAYHVTYVNATTGTKTVTQAAVTRDATTGAVTAQPALAVA